MTSDWFLEYDNEGEIYTNAGDASHENIERYLGMFDGATTFYCGISRRREDTGLQCLGEPDRRIIEGMRNGKSFVVRRVGAVGGTRVPLMLGASSAEVFLVDTSELLTPADALTVMDYFRETEELPAGFAAEPKSYVFGSGQ